MIHPLLHGSMAYIPHIVQRFVSEDQQQVSVPLTQGMFEVTEIIDSEMFIQEYLGPGIPFSSIVDLETMNDIFRLENNDKLSKRGYVS